MSRYFSKYKNTLSKQDGAWSIICVDCSNILKDGLDCQQKFELATFVTFNRFCPLSKPLPPSPLFLMDNIKMVRIPTKIK